MSPRFHANQLSKLIARVLTGLLWDRRGASTTFYAGAVFCGLAILGVASGGSSKPLVFADRSTEIGTLITLARRNEGPAIMPNASSVCTMWCVPIHKAIFNSATVGPWTLHDRLSDHGTR